MQRMKLDEAAFWQVIICSAAGIALLKISIALNLLRFSPTRWYTMSLWTSIGMPTLFLSMMNSSRRLMTGLYSICRSLQLHGRDGLLPPLQTHASTLG